FFALRYYLSYCDHCDRFSFPTRRSSDLSTFDGHLEQLETVIENPEIDLYVRGAVLEVYEKLSKDGLVSREEFIEYLRKLLKHQKDRKSTRLNSSHVSISYAVFCLKKKNK